MQGVYVYVFEYFFYAFQHFSLSWYFHCCWLTTRFKLNYKIYNDTTFRLFIKFLLCKFSICWWSLLQIMLNNISETCLSLHLNNWFCIYFGFSAALLNLSCTNTASNSNQQHFIRTTDHQQCDLQQSIIVLLWCQIFSV